MTRRTGRRQQGSIPQVESLEYKESRYWSSTVNQRKSVRTVLTERIEPNVESSSGSRSSRNRYQTFHSLNRTLSTDEGFDIQPVNLLKVMQENVLAPLVPPVPVAVQGPKVKLTAPFSGSAHEDAELWLESFDRCAESYRWVARDRTTRFGSVNREN